MPYCHMSSPEDLDLESIVAWLHQLAFPENTKKRLLQGTSQANLLHGALVRPEVVGDRAGPG